MSKGSPGAGPNPIVLVVGMLGVPMLGLGGFVMLQGRARSEVAGTLESAHLTGSPVHPNRCASGLLGEDAPRAAAQFHGVDRFATASPSRRVRVFEDPAKGPVVAIRDGDAAPVVVDRAGCSTFEVHLDELGEMVFDHWGLSGRLVLDCPEISAQVTFSRCFGGS